MAKYCLRDDGWPKGMCTVTYDPVTRRYICRHWSLGLSESGCGDGMWQKEAKDGMSVYPSNANHCSSEKGKE